MARRMLINATRPEEVRLAVVDDKTLESYEVAATESGLIKGNIYRGVVMKVQPSLDAAFVDIGTGKDALLRAEDVIVSGGGKGEGERKRKRIESLLTKGKTVMVQVSRDPIAHKGAQVTGNVSIAGRHLVLMPFDDVRGVSRRTDDDGVRDAARKKLADMNIPHDVGVIVRTNALDQPKATLNRDLNALNRLWKKIKKEANTGKGPKLLYSDQDLVVQALRDYLDRSISEVLVDDDEVFAKAKGYMASFMPRAKTELVRYTERMPLFSHFQLEEQIDRIYLRSVDLPSGGSIVIDGTEALTAIDVNSGRGTRGSSQEENAFRTNLEAAEAVARQLRLRDIGGLVVVDFIDMRSTKHNRQVEKTLRDSMKEDRARFTLSRISANGLLEINRQRVKKALQLRSHRECPTCGGAGTIASPELVALNLLRRVETRAAAGRLEATRIELHPELADAFQNDRRQEIAALEREFDIRIEVIAATGLHRCEERVEWVQRQQAAHSTLENGAVPAAVSAADLAGAVSGGSRSRKQTAATTPAQTDDSSGEDSEKKGRRRRRGGRRRKKTSRSADAGPKDSPTPPASSQNATDPPPPEKDTKTKKSRRRSRSSKTKRSQPAPSDPEADPSQPAGKDPFAY